MHRPRTDKEIREARDHFAALISKRATEPEFQALFRDSPYILSRTLPLRVEESDIRPLGRPGRSEPDFLAVPRSGHGVGTYGIVEIKRPDTTILTSPRKGTLILTRDAQTAVSQSRRYKRKLLETPRHIEQPSVILGSGAQIFLIMGLSDELRDRLSIELYRDELADLLPGDCRLIPYDELFNAFDATVPPQVTVLVPGLAGTPSVEEVMLLDRVARDPDLISTLRPMEFERLVAALLARDGYEVALWTRADFGQIDVVATKRGIVGNVTFAVECKMTRSVGVAVVQQLAGIVEHGRLTGGIVVTTSRFTPSALEVAQRMSNRMMLVDDRALRAWLQGTAIV